MTLSAVATLPLLAMTEALPGFPGHRDYVLVTADGDGRQIGRASCRERV